MTGPGGGLPTRLRRTLAAGAVGRSVRRGRKRLAIVRQTGRLHPDHIALAASGHRIYVDPGDRRGREIVDGLGRGHQPALVALWRQAVASLAPDLVIDVGTNYGEFVLNARYAPGTRVIAVEANPRVVPILQRSIDGHPDREQISLHAILASDRDGGTEHLMIDPAWSGSAATSLDRTQAGDGLIDLRVPVRTLDDLLATDGSATPGSLVLKVDTEGSEWQVLAGMSRLLGDARTVVAIVEFDPEHQRRSGNEPDVLFERLASLGRCWAVDWDGTATPCDSLPHRATDLVVVSDGATAAALGLTGA